MEIVILLELVYFAQYLCGIYFICLLEHDIVSLATC